MDGSGARCNPTLRIMNDDAMGASVEMLAADEEEIHDETTEELSTGGTASATPNSPAAAAAAATSAVAFTSAVADDSGVRKIVSAIRPPPGGGCDGVHHLVMPHTWIEVALNPKKVRSPNWYTRAPTEYGVDVTARHRLLTRHSYRI